ncbi:uncharacterized protein [Dermacentor albipictus]|uniref:uncharacterized protein isoform X2 n=1 Tax=Dermacentor albipictus TaxID=60249 RepID=UPI0038FBF652
MADKNNRKTAPSPSMTSRPRTYQNRAHKLATLFVMTAGSANATQFSTMFIVYGGAPFLLAYLAFLGCVAFPVLRLESNLAQFAGDGNMGIFSTVPFFIGVGYSMTTYALAHAVADTVPLSDALALLSSWTRSFDWHHDCPGGWMTRNLSCHAIRRGSIPCKLARERLTHIYHRVELTEGVPLAGKDGVKLVPASSYEQSGVCIPDLADTALPYDFRRHSIWEQSSYDMTRAEPVFAIAAIWLLVFAIAHRGLLRLKTMWSHALYVSLESVGVTGTIYMGIERLNSFGNRFQEDVMFVLVADTASKGIGTVVSFLFLGHLSHTTGIGVHMLVDADFNFIVSITPQAVSLVPHPEFWSRVHSLWVVSMMLPKFLIVPDIIVELLSVSFPPILVNRRATHFVVCAFLFLLSIATSFPGGAKVVAVVSQSQSDVRFFLLALEVLVILQFYGVRRLGVDSRIMTNEDPGGFVNVCWTSVTPLTLIALLSAKLMQGPREKRYPPFIEGAIFWLEAVEVSFIPVYAVVFILCTGLSLRDCLVPLPTWTPVNWELSMLYRQHLVVEGMDSRQLEEKETVSPNAAASPVASPSRPLSPLSDSSSSSGQLGTHLILTSEAKISPATSDWRYDSSDDDNAKPPVKWRSPPDKVVQCSGTVHKSLSLSAVWRAVKSDAASPKPARTKGPSPARTSSPPHVAHLERDASPVLAKLPLVPGSDAGPTAPVADGATRADSEPLEELPVDSCMPDRAHNAAGVPQQMQSPPQVPSPCRLLPDAAAPSAVDAHGSAPGQQLATEEEHLPAPIVAEISAFPTARPEDAPKSGKPDLAVKPINSVCGHGGTVAKGHHGHGKLTASVSPRRLATRKASSSPKTEDRRCSCDAGALFPTSPLLPSSSKKPTSPAGVVSAPEQAPVLKRRLESSPKRLGKDATTAVTTKDGRIKSPLEKIRNKNGAPEGPSASKVPKTEDLRSFCDAGVLSPALSPLPTSVALSTSPSDAVSTPESAPALRRRPESGFKQMGKKATGVVTSKGGEIKSAPEKAPGRKGTSHSPAAPSSAPSKIKHGHKAAKSRKKTAGANALWPASNSMSPSPDKVSKAANHMANQTTTAKALASDGKAANRRASASTAALPSEKKAASVSPARKIRHHRHKRREHMRSGAPSPKTPVKRAHSPKPAEGKPSAPRLPTATPPGTERGKKEAPAATVPSPASKAKTIKTRGQIFTHKGKPHDDHAFSKAGSSKASEGAAITSPTEGGQSLKERPPTLPLSSSMSAIVSETEDLNRTGDKLLELLSLLESASTPRQSGRDVTKTRDSTGKPAVARASREFQAGAKEPTSLPSRTVQAPTATEPYDGPPANALDSGSRVGAPRPSTTSATAVDDVSGVLTGRFDDQAARCFDVNAPGRAPVADDQCSRAFGSATGLANDNAKVDRTLVTVNMHDGNARDRTLTLDGDANAPRSSVPAHDVGSDVMGRTKDDDENQAKAAQLPLAANETGAILHARALDSFADVSRPSATVADNAGSGAVGLVIGEAKDQAEASQRLATTYQPDAPATTGVPAPHSHTDLPPSTSAATGGGATSGGVERAEAKVEATKKVDDTTARPSLPRRSKRKGGSRNRVK